MARVLVVDNYDSFVYNLVQYLGQLGAEPLVFRNDQIDPTAAVRLDPDGVLVSPGPGRPEDAGCSCSLIETFAERVPVLGVCLGHQCIAEVFGAKVVRGEVMHGKTSEVRHDGRGLFAGLPVPVVATRYHSLVVDPRSVPARLEVSAWSPEGVVMALRHRELPVEGVQFHPESIFTTGGHRMLANWLATCGQEGVLDLVEEAEARVRTRAPGLPSPSHL